MVNSLSIIPSQSPFEEPETYLCKEFRTPAQRFIDLAEKLHLLPLVDMISALSLSILLTAPVFTLCITFTATQIVIPLSLLTMFMMIVTEKVPDHSFNYLRVQYQSLVFGVQAKIIISLAIAVFTLPFPMALMANRPIITLGTNLIRLFLLSKLLKWNSNFAEFCENRLKIIQMKKQLDKVKTEMSTENAVTLFHSFGSLSQDMDLNGLVDIFPQVFSNLDDKSYFYFSVTSKKINHLLTKHPYWGTHTASFKKNILREKWIQRTAEFRLVGKAVGIYRSDKNILRAKNSFDLKTLIEVGYNVKRAIKGLALSDPQRFSLAINALDPDVYSVDPNGYWDKDKLNLCLYRAYLRKDIKKADSLLNDFIDTRNKNKALAIKIKHQLIRNQDVSDLVLHGEVFCKGEYSQLINKIKRYSQDFNLILNEFNRNSKRSNVFKWSKGLVSDPWKMQLMFFQYHVFNPSKNAFSSLHSLQGELKDKALVKIAKIQAQTNIFDALETLNLVNQSENLLLSKTLLYIASQLPPQAFRQREILVNFAIERAERLNDHKSSSYFFDNEF